MPNIDAQILPLDVGLNNGRSYVQGSEMLARVVALAQMGHLHTARIERAHFHRMTDLLVGIDQSAKALDLDQHLASITLATATGKQMYFLTEASGRAPERTISETLIVPVAHADLNTAAPNRGQFRFSASPGLWALLDVVVQAAKAFLSSVNPGSGGFMLTSVGANSLPLSPDDKWTRGQVMIEPLRRFQASGLVQTMNRFEITADTDRQCSGIFGFAFQPGGDSPTDNDRG